ncbi:ComEA family DNA-binding protein [Mesonia aestuariivivens]|uniref:Helix-hairpin-helix domain-containing protein n=1 Tax=Mesonia aestuariivivens TaxID=2796128 RepID=A0ABS6VZ04_9FLAO|nr:helix-hairpin-helix domain-containing protein [Mesonia aestuariivivens]MBW2960841.1 helix-hairpin-helix domain-containing protein [Mesonia aestuariivivens]
MKFKKSHFVFMPKQQSGVFLLIILILIAMGGMYYVHHLPIKDQLSASEQKQLKEVERFLDSIKKENQKPKKDTIYPFNPNYINNSRGYRLGMSLVEIQRLKDFRAQGKWINSAREFQIITKISDSIFNKISPSFNFPEWVKKRNLTNKNYSKPSKYSAKRKDLNTVTREELIEVYGIGEKLSQRIINYRLKIGGFVNDIQLKDIYGLPYETEQNILKEYTVLQPVEIEKISINEASLIQLSEVIYFNYELAREIIEYRKLHEGIKSFEELAKIESFPAYKIDRIKLYVKIN